MAFLILNIVVFSLTFAYFVIIFSIYRHWSLAKTEEAPASFAAQTPIAVLIAARNEAANIGTLLTAILAQNYPKNLLQIVVINDDSTDETAEIVDSFTQKNNNIILLNAENTGKKAALSQAINTIKTELIVTTDADCVPNSENWLREIAFFYEKNQTKAIAAPVIFHREQNFLGCFQTLDFLGMMGVTAAGIGSKTMLLCNGANFAFPQSVFFEVNGYEGTTQWASGDDVFLLHKIAEKYPQNLHFLKSKQAIVLTEPKHDFSGFLAQRLRWGTKNRSYTKSKISLVLGMVWFYCLLLLGLGVLSLFFKKLFLPFFISFFIKSVIDYFYLKKISIFFNRQDLLRIHPFLLAQIAYILYLSFVGILANFIKKYEWKGRNVS